MSNHIFHELLQSREQKKYRLQKDPSIRNKWMASGVLDVCLEHLTAYYVNEVQ